MIQNNVILEVQTMASDIFLKIEYKDEDVSNRKYCYIALSSVVNISQKDNGEVSISLDNGTDIILTDLETASAFIETFEKVVTIIDIDVVK